MSLAHLRIFSNRSALRQTFCSGTERWFLTPVLVLAAVSLAACSSAPSAVTSRSTGPGGQAIAGSTIVIKNFTFSPETLSVKPGETITVRNEDSVTHTLSSDSGAFSTGDLSGGSSTTLKAPTKPGTYAYRCSIHQFMTGTVVVT